MPPDNLHEIEHDAKLESLKFFVSQSTLNEFATLDISEPELPMTLGKFELMRHLGTGGMGSVFLAKQTDVGRTVALKVIRDFSLEQNQEQVETTEQLRKEAEFASEFQHPNIVTVYEFVVIEGVACISMQYVAGTTARELSIRNQLSIQKAVDCTVAIGNALSKLHAKGIVHRDVKPGNILCSNEEEYLLSDFGIALTPSKQRSENSKSVAGTVLYASPEQLDDSNTVGHRSDIYSLGATLYHLLTGRAPVRADSVSEAIKLVKTETPVLVSELNHSVDKDLEAIVMCSLEKSPANRYQTVEDMLNDLSHWQTGKPIQARPLGQFSRFVRWCKREPIVSGLVAACFALLSVSTIVATSSYYAQASATKRVESAYRTQQESLDTSNELLLNVLDLFRTSVNDLAADDRYRLKAAATFKDWIEQLDSKGFASKQSMTDAQVRFSLGQVFDAIGDKETSESLLAEAETAFESAAKDDPAWNVWLGAILGFRAKKTMAKGDPAAAILLSDEAIEMIDSSGVEENEVSLSRTSILSLKSLALQKVGKSDAARALAESLVADDFEWGGATASDLANIGNSKQRLLNILLMQGKLAEPLVAYETQSKFWDKAIQMHPNSFALQMQATEALIPWGVYLGNDDPAKSLLVRQECYQGFQSLLKRNPGRGVIAASLFSAANNVVFGALKFPGGDIENAKKVIEETQQIAERFQPAFGDQARFRSNYSLFLKNAAIVDSNDGNFEKAIEKLTLAQANLQALLEGSPKNDRLRYRYVGSLVGLAEVQLGRNDTEAHEIAEKTALRAATEVEQLKSEFYNGVKFEVGILLAELAGLHAESDELDRFQMLHFRANEITGHKRSEFLQMQFEKLFEMEQPEIALEVIEQCPTKEPAVLELLRVWKVKIEEQMKP
jgi:serine/threonine protein kinase